jgi:organic radical activating enzyme
MQALRLLRAVMLRPPAVAAHMTRRLASSPAAAGAAPPPVHLPQPWRVTLDTNPDDCNLACIMCEQHSVHSGAQSARVAAGIRKRRMAPVVFEGVLHQLAATGGLREVIPSTMGEPLMYRHMDELLAAVRAAGPGVRLNLTTNATFHPGKMGRSVKQWAAELLPLLSDVKLSWNGATAATQEDVMRGSKFETQLANLRAWLAERDALAAAGGNRASVTLQLTFMARNIAEVPDVVALGIALGVDRIKGHHLWAHFSPIAGDDLRRSPQSVAVWNSVAARCRALAAATPLPSGRHIKLEHFEDLVWAPPAPASETAVATAAAAVVAAPSSGGSCDGGGGSGGGAAAASGAAAAASRGPPPPPPTPVDPASECPFLGREAWVNHAGEFAPCCAPDASRRSLGSFGNVGDPGGLLAIWNGAAYRELLTTYKSKPLCQSCHMRRPPAAAAAAATSGGGGGAAPASTASTRLH